MLQALIAALLAGAFCVSRASRNEGGTPAERLCWRRDVGTLLHEVAADYYHGRRLWVTDRAEGTVLAVSSRDGRLLRRLRGCPGARGIAFVGSAWVAAARRDANTLAVWSQRDRSRKLVRVGGRPYAGAEVVLP